MRCRAHRFGLSAVATVLALGALVSRHVGAQPVAELSGQWQGVYFAYPDVMRLDVDLRGSAGALEGELRFAPLDERSPNALGAFKGSYRVSGRFDAQTRTFALNPGAWVERPRLLATPLAFAGVLSTDSRAAAGIFPKAPMGMNPHFALARPAQARQMLLDPAGKLYGDNIS